MVADWSGSLVSWEAELAVLKERVGRVFGRLEVRRSAGAFIDSLLVGVERKTAWLIAEEAGLAKPYRIQSLLGARRLGAPIGCGIWCASNVLEALGDDDGVLVVDETGFLKKG